MSKRGASRPASNLSRAQRGGGREIALPATSQTMMGPDGEWFGPGRPMPAMAPPSVRGRRWDFGFGQNQQVQPRWDSAVTFPQLRYFADRHDLTRLAIETRKDQMARLTWTFGLVDSDEDLSTEQQARADAFRVLLRRPDGENFWSDWLRMLLEDLLVIDAPSVFVHRTMGQEIIGLHQLDGATIKPVVDAVGRTPRPPETAYQQVLKGMPAINYTTQDLVYRPRNRRVHTLWGFSPVEQILATINLALRRQVWQHSYFTNGNIPDSLIGVPSTWSPDQIRDFQDWFDGVLAGNTERRRGAVFVPGEVAKSYVPTKDAEMFGAAEEWLARLVCYCFGLPHQALVKEVNRATADNAAEQALQDGLAPIMGWVASVMNGILIDQFGETELEFRWADDKEMDPEAQDRIWAARVEKGMATRNEWRGAVGEKPRPEPEADMLMTSSPVTPLAAADAAARSELLTPPELQGQVPGEDEDEDEDEEEDEDKGSGDVVAPEGEDGAEEEEEASKAASSALGKVAASSDPRYRALTVTRRLVERRRAQLQRLLERGLARVGARVVAAVETALDEIDTTRATKAADEHLSNTMVDAALRAVGSFDFLIDATADILEEIAEDTTRVAAAMMGPTMTDDLVEQVSERSIAQARDRAAELVGRRVLADGSIIDNPNPRWAITQTTRDMIRDTITTTIRNNDGSDAIIQALQDSHAFSPARAEMVSRTEVARVNSRAAMDTYHAAADAGVEVMKEWVLGADPCDICQANADQGPIPLDEDFASGDSETPSHPHCECATVPVVE